MNRVRVVEKHGVGDITNNGERVICLCEENSPNIGFTIFMQRNIHKLAWASAYGRTQSQIDHIIINIKWRGSLQDVLVMRNTDVGSNHNLIVAKINLKLRNAKTETTTNQRPDISKVKDTLIMVTFCSALRNRFSIVLDKMALTIDDLNYYLNVLQQ